MLNHFHIKLILLIMVVGLFLFPYFVFSQDVQDTTEEIFSGKVIEIIEEKEIINFDDSITIGQKLKIEARDGTYDGQEIIFDGTQYSIVASNQYEIGDKVMISFSKDSEGNDVFYVIDYVRQSPLYWLAALFAVIVVLVGRLKGLRALIVLVFTFAIILGFIIPRILDGASPLWISILGSIVILVLSVYITEGLKRTSTIAIGSVLIALCITGVLSVWFSAISKLTGFESEDALYLLNISSGEINIQGLLLAGIIIGTLGVLDDIVVTQVELVTQLRSTNPGLTKIQIYSKAMRVGVTHMAAMVNTLFLAYAGAALPLLVLFCIKEPPFLTMSQVLNNEVVATEIVRTLVGSIGLILSVPISTLLAIRFLKKHSDSHHLEKSRGTNLPT